MENKYQYASDPTRPNSSSGIRYNKKGAPVYRHISWGAIVAGTLIALIIMMILNLLGIGFGLGVINPAEGAIPFSALSTGAIVWWVVSNLIAIFAGSYIAGRLAGVLFGFGSTLHGILSWCLYSLTFFWILTTSLGSLMSGVGSIVSGTLSAIMPPTELSRESAPSQNSMISMHEVKREVKQILRDTEGTVLASDTSNAIGRPALDNNGQNLRQNLSNEEHLPDEEIEEIAREVLYNNGEGFTEQVDRQDLANIIQDRTYLSTSESRDVADVMIRQYRKAKRNATQQEEGARRQAEENGQQVTEAASTAAIWISASLILGAVVAGIGGRTGKPYTFPGNKAEESDS